jgi:putative ABC transport system ATP-binding protein
MIQIKNVAKIYQKDKSPEVQALKDASLNIRAGEFVAIVGPSGSGKSTLMNIMGLLDRPTSGSYLLYDKEVSGLNIDELAKLRNRKIGFVFQSFHLLPKTTSLENVEVPLIYSDRSDLGELAKKALKEVGLEHRTHHMPSELSGGEQQRVAIARALVNDPEIIFADEPTGNLDTHSGLEIISIFQNLNSEGRTIVLITHDQKLAEHVHRVISIVDGRIKDDKKIKHPKDASSELSNLPREADHEEK